ncbi:MAG: zf-TFIIB domain-containing protein [Proteobacteria bacterium]|nr:zf-TFIIB domain-containing protein [Pseudomonadota bacterium]
MEEKVCIKIAEIDAEELYFRQQESDKIKALHQRAQEAADEAYRERHRDHCFRCGTKSLVQVEYENVIIDICANKDCGAMHLDPGELEAILDQHDKVKKVHRAILAVFR